MSKKTQFFCLFLLWAVLPGAFSELAAQRVDDPKEAEPDKLVDARTRKAIERGLKFLVRKQIKTGNLKGAMGQGGYAGVWQPVDSVAWHLCVMAVLPARESMVMKLIVALSL